MKDLWFRTIATMAIASLLYLLVFTLIAPPWMPIIVGWLQPRLGQLGATMAAMMLFALPPILLAVGLFTHLDGRSRAFKRGDNETRCRRCGHILRGLSEPRCPECGEKI
jgi:hypothetical protein